MTYKKIMNAKVPQSQPLNNRQVKNNAGGYSYTVNKWSRLMRFLIIGSEGGTYYVNERKLTNENVGVVRECLEEDGVKTVDMIVRVSKEGLAPKNSPAILALVMCVVYGSDSTRAYAYSHLSDVCRTATHLFEFLDLKKSDAFNDGHNGFGRGLRNAIKNWYVSKGVDSAAYQMIKYRNRNGWTHKDVIVLSHPAANGQMSDLFNWAVNGVYPPNAPAILEGFMKAQEATLSKEWAKLVKEYRLPMEALPTEALNSAEVWKALAEDMQATNMIRNLGNLTKHGVLTPNSQVESKVVSSLRDEAFLKKGRIHPIGVLMALRTYGSGAGHRGSGSWTPNNSVVYALNDAFYLSFKNVKPTGKRFLVGLDVSGSMSSEVANTGLRSCEITAAYSMMLKRVEKTAHIMAFNDGITELNINPSMSLEEVMRKTTNINFGGTDCSLPMIYAAKNNIPVDVFVVITDSETWAGGTHPSVALNEYRKKMGINAKLIVLATTATNISIADPNDNGMLDICGFSSEVFSVMESFINEEI